MLKAAGGFNTPLQQLFLLEERVRLAGSALPDEVDLRDRFQGVKCIIHGVHCVIDMRTVAEVFDDREVTPIPGSVDWIEGVMNFRGILVPVYDMQGFLCRDASSGKSPGAGSGPLIIIRNGNEPCAIRVNRMAGMQKFMQADFHPAAESGNVPAAVAPFADAGINNGGHIWYRLDIYRLLDTMTGEDPARQ